MIRVGKCLNAEVDPLIELVEQLQLRSQIEVTHSPTAIVKDEAKDF